MGCLRHRKKEADGFTDHKWDYISLTDFKAKGCGPGFFYGYLWFNLFLSVAVYAVDIFIAVNLLAFSRWSSKIKPAIPIDVSKWIFSGCIIASFVNLAFEGIRAARVMKRRNVAECYMDSLAARWESIRLGSGQGWKRFLVFTELTKSNKGAEYIALFTYFNFQSWIRVVLCSGPRQVVNALTLRSVYVTKLEPTATSVGGSILGFFDKIKILASEDYQQAVILSGMCFTIVVWVFSAIYLLSAVLFYLFFLIHWIPRADGGLTGYCERKVNKRLTKIVTTKVNKALAKGQAKREKADALAMGNGEKPPLERAATLPVISDFADPSDEDSLPCMPVLGHNGTSVTLPVYSSRPETPLGLDRTAVGQKRPLHRQTGSSASAASHSSRAPLVGAAADIAHDRAPVEAAGAHFLDYNSATAPRPGTSGSQRSFGPRPGYGFANGTLAGSSLRRHLTASPEPMDTAITRRPVGGPTTAPANPYGRPNERPQQPPYMGTYDANAPGGRARPTPSDAAHEMATPVSGFTAPSAYQGWRNLTGSGPAGGPRQPPRRNFTAPMPAGGPIGALQGRPGTAHSVRSASSYQPYRAEPGNAQGRLEGPYRPIDEGGRRY